MEQRRHLNLIIHVECLKIVFFFAYFTLQTDTLKRFIYDSDFRQSLASHCGYDLYKYKE